MVSGDIFNQHAWKYIIKNNLNDETIKELYTLLITKIKMPPYVKDRIDEHGQERFIKDVHEYNHFMYDKVIKMFKCINENTNFLE